MATPTKIRGFKWNPTGLYLSVYVNGTEIARFDDGTNDLRIINHGLRVDSGGIGISAGAIVSDDATASTSSISGSIFTDGGVGIVKDVVAGTARIIDRLTYADRIYHANAYSSTITADTTATQAKSGMTYYIATDSTFITLPAMTDATLRGATYTIVNTGVDGAAEIGFTPSTGDKIVGCGFAGTDNKSLALTKTTAKAGDMCTVMCDGTDGWYITSLVGTWTSL